MQDRSQMQWWGYPFTLVVLKGFVKCLHMGMMARPGAESVKQRSLLFVAVQ